MKGRITRRIITKAKRVKTPAKKVVAKLRKPRLTPRLRG